MNSLNMQNFKGQRFYEALPEADASFHERTSQHNSSQQNPHLEQVPGQAQDPFLDPFQQNPQQQGPYEPISSPENSLQKSPFPRSSSYSNSLDQQSLYDSKSLRAASFKTQETQYSSAPPAEPENESAYLAEGTGAAGVPPNWRPRRLQVATYRKILRLVIDILMAAVALLFMVYGFLVLSYDGKPADRGTMGWRLHEISQYAPTVFPVIFAALVGNGMKSIISYRLQNLGGAKVRAIEQYIGSQSLLRAFTTQFRLRAFNPLGAFIILLWALSPLGGQASLRVISIGASYPTTPETVAAFYTFGAYGYGSSQGSQEAQTDVSSPVVASMMAASLLASRNQDLWGNIRVPAIEPLEKATNLSEGSWLPFDQSSSTNLTYPSLVGAPVGKLPSSGNTSFVLPSSYLKVSCASFGEHDQKMFANFSSPQMMALLPEGDCAWSDTEGGSRFQVGVSTQCDSLYRYISSNTTRKARRFVWENIESTSQYTRAECHFTTTFVEANVTCTGSASGQSAESECKPTHVRRTTSPLGLDGNWTAMDIGTVNSAIGVVGLVTELYPSAGFMGNSEPVVSYMVDPYRAVLATNEVLDTPTYTVGKETFEIRIAQILNSIMVVGMAPTDVTGFFDTSLAKAGAPGLAGNVSMLLDANNSQLQYVVRCYRPWLGVLVAASFGAFALAVVGAVLRLLTIVPDVMESVSLAFLANRTHGLYGSSTWSATEWALANRDRRVVLADIHPGAEVGCIALAPLDDGLPVGKVQIGKMYI